MRLSFGFDNVLLAIVLGCAAIVALQHDARAVACDNKCRYIQDWINDNGNGTYTLYSWKEYDCSVCVNAGGCSNTNKEFGLPCEEDEEFPQQLGAGTKPSILCPLPAKGKAQGTGTPGQLFDIGMGVYACYPAS